MWGEKDLIQPNPIIIPQIESKTSVNNLEEILQFNFDYYLIGPYDLSLSINMPGKFDNPEFLCYINKVYDMIPKQKIAVHIPSNIKKELPKYQNCGIKGLGMDTIALIDYNKETLKNVKV